ncbi:MAG: Gfo/Idh/MocA family protein [Eubacteriaceae bacterium]|jgi:predicted dehydrogenase
MVKVVLAGLGNIAPRAAEGIIYAENADFYGVVSASREKAVRFEEQFGVRHQYATLEEALDDDQVDLIYLTLPNQLHYGSIVKCLEAGKSVLCEKPMLDTQDKIRELFGLARAKGCMLMEAQKELFTPLTQKLGRLVRSGAIGRLMAVRADYSGFLPGDGVDPGHWVLADEFGGCSYDIGVYPIAWANAFAGAPIKRIGTASAGKEGRADWFMSASITYENGVAADVSASWLWSQPDVKGRGFLGGTDGFITADNYWKGTQARLVTPEGTELIKVGQKSDFTGQIEHICRCIEEGRTESPVLGEIQSLEIAKVLEAVRNRQ